MAKIGRPDPQTLQLYFNGSADAASIESVERWRKLEPEAFEQWAHLWRETEPEQPGRPFDREASWQRVAAELALARSPKRYLVPMAMAACLVLVSAIVFLANQRSHWDLVEVTGSARRTLTLPDGSQAALQAGSRLSYRDGETRVVELEGRALFDAIHLDRPFEVRTAHARIQVIGTNFDVWSRGGRTEITLREGSVRIIAANGEEQVLEPSQRAVCDEDGFVVRKESVNVEDILAWTRGSLYFRSQPLGRIVAELSAVNQVPIEIGPGIDRMQTVTAHFQPGELAGHLGQLGLTLNLTVVPLNSGYALEVPAKP